MLEYCACDMVFAKVPVDLFEERCLLGELLGVLHLEYEYNFYNRDR